MSDDVVEVKVNGDATGLGTAMKQASSSVSGAMKDIHGSLDGALKSVATTVGKIQGAFLAMTAIFAAGGAMKALIKDAVAWNSEATAMSKALGITTEKASIMNVALAHLGIESGTYIQASRMLSKQINSNGQAFDTLGVSVKGATGQYRPVTEVMGDVNKKLAAIKNPIQQNIAGMQVYGRAWADLKPILRLNAEEMANAETRAKQLGLIVGPEGEKAAKQYKEQLRDLDLVNKSLTVQIGNALLPAVKQTGSTFAQQAPLIGEVFAGAIKFAGIAIVGICAAFKAFADTIAAGVAQINEAIHGNFREVAIIGQLWEGDMLKHFDSVKEAWNNVFNPQKLPESKAPDIDAGPKYDFSKEKNKKDESRVPKWENELSMERLAHDMSKAEESAFWEAKLALCKVGSKEYLEVQKKELEARLTAQKEARKMALDVTKAEIEEHAKLAEQLLDIEKQGFEQTAELDQTKYQDQVAALSAFEDRRLQIQRQAIDDQLDLLQKDPNHNIAEVYKLQQQAEQLEVQHQSKLSEIRHRGMMDSLSTWKSAQDSMASMFDQGMQKILQGTLTLKDALRTVWGSMGNIFIEELVSRPLAQWAAAQVTRVALSASGAAKEFAVRMGFISAETAAHTTKEVGLTAATAAGESARIGIATTAAATDVSVTMAAADAKIMAHAATAAAGAASSQAPIPFVGPVLAIAAMGAIMAAVMALRPGKSASGGYDIPSGVNPVTQLHQEEMVLPAKYANVIRSMASGSGSQSAGSDSAAGGDVHLHVHAVDAKSVERLFKANGAALAAVAREQVRNGAGLTKKA